MKNDNFDLILAIPCNSKKGKMIGPKAEAFLETFSDSPLKYEKKELEIKNADYDNKSNLLEYANIFCEQIEEHSKYELISNDETSMITTDRTPLAFGQVILYKDELYEEETNKDFIPICCYNFFAVLSKLSVRKSWVKKDASFDNYTFNIIYFVVPDINYHDLTLLMDQSHDLWCNIMGNINSQMVFRDYLNDTFGYKYLGKIYHIIFSDSNQFDAIKDDEHKLFNILASEEYKGWGFSHQIELSENTNEYTYSSQGKPNNFTLTKKEKFFDDYNMYESYRAYASIYSYYYVIHEKEKETFVKRISPDKNNEDFSSEANILFVLETEIFKITACIVSSLEINKQINNPRMGEIRNMFRRFINTRPLFEKLNYRYLGAQKEADFIYKQFRISDIFADYDRKRELLKNYCEVNDSIISKRSTTILGLMGLLFALITGRDKFSLLSGILFDNENVVLNEESIISILILLFIIGIILYIIQPIKHIKQIVKYINRALEHIKNKIKIS